VRREQIFSSLNKAYFSAEMHEKEVIEHLPLLLRGVEVFVDVGASLGQYTYFGDQNMHGGRIFAVEADPLRFEGLERNCRRWASASDNELIAVQGAASDQDGEIAFYTTNTNISGGLFRHDVSRAVLESAGLEELDWQEIVVNAFRLDTLLADCSPDLIKVDVEGAELRVLKGATKILKAGRARFLIELHGGWIDPEGQKSAAEVYAFMRSFGYHAVDFHGKALFAKRGLLEAVSLRVAALWKAVTRRIPCLPKGGSNPAGC
jgi:FkbM family methyltransferase